jgi:hypothetical protein
MFHALQATLQGRDMKSDIELISEAEAVLDETLAYEAARAAHQLKRRLGIDIQQINLEVRPNDSGNYRVVCTISSLARKDPADPRLTTMISARDGDGKSPV